MASGSRSPKFLADSCTEGVSRIPEGLLYSFVVLQKTQAGGGSGGDCGKVISFRERVPHGFDAGIVRVWFAWHIAGREDEVCANCACRFVQVSGECRHGTGVVRTGICP